MQVMFVVMFYYVDDYELEHTFTFFYCFLACNISISEGFFVGTASSIAQLVEDFNGFFKCPSDNGKCKGNSDIQTLIPVRVRIMCNREQPLSREL